jgi:hypothetical protein
MHKLYLSILLFLPFSLSGMQQSSSFQRVAPEFVGAGGAIAGGTTGLVALGYKTIAIEVMKYGGSGCLIGISPLPIILAGTGYFAAKGAYNWWTTKK